jgi:hypothetical protein
MYFVRNAIFLTNIYIYLCISNSLNELRNIVH